VKKNLSRAAFIGTAKKDGQHIDAAGEQSLGQSAGVDQVADDPQAASIGTQGSATPNAFLLDQHAPL
jgi:hypothetical protein